MSVGKGRPDRLTGPPGGSERSERGGMFIPVGKGRPDRLTGPPGGSERSERGGMFIPVGKGRTDRLTGPPGGSERSERGGVFHLSRPARPFRDARGDAPFPPPSGRA